MDQVAVGPVDLHRVEARIQGPPGRLPESPSQILYLRGGQFPGKGVVLVEGQGRGSHGFPAACRLGHPPLPLPGRVRGGLPPRVGQLDRDPAARIPDGLDQGPEGPDLLVVPEPEVRGADAALGGNGGSLHHDQADPSQGSLGVVPKVPFVRQSVPGRVLAHGGHEQAVRDVQGTKDQGFCEICGHAPSIRGTTISLRPAAGKRTGMSAFASRQSVPPRRRGAVFP